MWHAARRPDPLVATPVRRGSASATTRISLAPTVRGDDEVGRAAIGERERRPHVGVGDNRRQHDRPEAVTVGGPPVPSVGARPRPARDGPARRRRPRRARPRAARSRRRSATGSPVAYHSTSNAIGVGIPYARPSASDGSSSAAAYVSLPIVHCSIGASQMCSAQSACALTSRGSARTGTSHSATCSSGWPSVAQARPIPRVPAEQPMTGQQPDRRIGGPCREQPFLDGGAGVRSVVRPRERHVLAD